MTRTLVSQRSIRWTMLAMFLAISSTVALSAWAMPGGRHGGGHAMMGGGFGPGMSERGIDRMLDGLNASDAQRTQIKQIAAVAAQDLRGQRETRRELAQRSAAIFAAPTVDANAAEQVRQQMLALHDQSSKRMLTAMLDISRVLTPEQRAQLAERMKQRRAAMEERRQRMERQQAPQQR